MLIYDQKKDDCFDRIEILILKINPFLSLQSQDKKCLDTKKTPPQAEDCHRQ